MAHLRRTDDDDDDDGDDDVSRSCINRPPEDARKNQTVGVEGLFCQAEAAKLVLVLCSAEAYVSVSNVLKRILQTVHVHLVSWSYDF